MTRCFEQIVDAVDLLPGFVERETAAHDLQAQMVLLVDHQADGFLRAEGDAARAVGGGQFAADELALDQKLTIRDGQRRAR